MADSHTVTVLFLHLLTFAVSLMGMRWCSRIICLGQKEGRLRAGHLWGQVWFTAHGTEGETDALITIQKHMGTHPQAHCNKRLTDIKQQIYHDLHAAINEGQSENFLLVQSFTIQKI